MLRAADGAPLWAGLFAVLALLQLVVAFRGRAGVPGPASRGPAGAVEPAFRGRARAMGSRPSGRPLPPPRQHEELARLQRRRTKAWLWISVFGWAAAFLGVVLFPPMSLLIAGISVYSVHRYLRARRTLTTRSQTDA